MTESDDLIRLSTGVVLRAVAAPVWLLQDAVRRIPKPVAPMRMNADRGYEEADENDPAYLAAADRYAMDAAGAANDALLLLGTEIVEVPDGFERHTDDGWIEELAAVGLDVSGMHRRMAWLKYWAVRSASDVARVIGAAARKTGVREEDVSDAVASFRGREERLADSGADGAEASANGYHLSAVPARARARTRRA